GGRELGARRKAEALGSAHALSPPGAACEAEDFDGRFAFRLESAADAAAIAAAIKRAGAVEHVTVAEDESAAPRLDACAVEGGRTRHLRVDLRRLDALM